MFNDKLWLNLGKSYDFILSTDGRIVPEDLSPSRLKLEPVSDGFTIHNITGIRTQIVRRLDDQGYEIRRRMHFDITTIHCKTNVRSVGHYHVRSGHIVYINDSTIFVPPARDTNTIVPRGSHDSDVQLRLSLNIMNSEIGVQLANLGNADLSLRLTAFAAFFGADLTARVVEPANKLPRMAGSEGLPLFRESDNSKGCLPYNHVYPDSVLVVERGDCTFLEKLLQARHTGAAGVLVISDDETAINPTADAQEAEEAGDISDAGLLLLTKTAGNVLLNLMETIDMLGTGQVMVAIHRDPLAESSNRGTTYQKPQGEEAPDVSEEVENENKDRNQDTTDLRILYINGHPLLNTRLLV